MVVTGPTLHNAEFREAYLADPEGTEFEVYPYANALHDDVRLENSQQSLGMDDKQIAAEVLRRSKIKETDPAKVQAGKHTQYVRFNGFGQTQVAEMGRIITRAHTAAARLDAPVDQTFTRATGAYGGRAGHFTAKQAQNLYSRRSDAARG